MQEERRFYKFVWNRETLIFPVTGKDPWRILDAPLFALNFASLDLQRADFRGSSLAFCDFTNCNFEQANLIDVNMAQCNLSSTNFQHTHCEGAVFNGCKVGGAIFDGTYMERAKSVDKMKVRLSEERSDELPTQSLVTKTVHTCTSVQDAAPSHHRINSHPLSQPFWRFVSLIQECHP